MKSQKQKSKWVAIRKGSGEVTGYIEMFRGPKGKYFTVPGASRFRERGK